MNLGEMNLGELLVKAVGYIERRVSLLLRPWQCISPVLHPGARLQFWL